MGGEDVILIADAGSTKTDWCLMEALGRIIMQVKTEGLNAAIASAEQLYDYLRSAKNSINGSFGYDSLMNEKISEGVILPTEVFYYGAGCASEAICRNVADKISEVWGCKNVEVASDMLGACRALFGDDPGIACILGTGSNSALYDGSKIRANTPPLGYILGDEGSGAALGKRFISDIFKGVAPESNTNTFLEETGLTKDEVIRRVYREPNANRFLASFAKYIARHIEEPYFKDMVTEEFIKFLTRNVLNYDDVHGLPISFIGSIAEHFSQPLDYALSFCKLTKGKVLPSPMPGLISYHSKSSES